MSNSQDPLSIAVVGGHQLTRFGLRATLDTIAGFRVVGDAATAQDAAAIAAEAAVTLLDTVHPCKQACALTSELRALAPQTAVLVVANRLCSCTHRVLAAGAAGVVLKDACPQQLAGAIRSVSAGYAVVPKAMVGALRGVEHAEEVQPPDDREHTPAPRPAPDVARLRGSDAARNVARLATLTSRERDVLRCIASGASNAEAARRLHLSEGTVKSHVQHLLSKLGVRDRLHAVIFAYEHGFAAGGLETGPELGMDHQLRVAQVG